MQVLRDTCTEACKGSQVPECSFSLGLGPVFVLQMFKKIALSLLQYKELLIKY